MHAVGLGWMHISGNSYTTALQPTANLDSNQKSKPYALSLGRRHTLLSEAVARLACLNGVQVESWLESCSARDARIAACKAQNQTWEGHPMSSRLPASHDPDPDPDPVSLDAERSRRASRAFRIEL